jgi:hypothetical protein
MANPGKFLSSLLHSLQLKALCGKENSSAQIYFKRSENNQHYALNCTTSLFNIQAHTCFGSSLPSSGSFFDSSELLEMQIESKKFPDDSRPLPKNAAACILNKGVVQFSA